MAGGRVSDPRRGRKPKAPPAEPPRDEGFHYRTRATQPGPFGDTEEPWEGPLPDVLKRAEADDAAGMAPVIEYRLPGAPWMRWRRPLLIEDLARLGLAHQKDGSKWQITQEGQRRLALAAKGELPPSGWVRASSS